MLRINLLPPYIYDRQKRRNLMLLWGGVVAAVVILFVFWTTSVSKALQTAKNDRTEAERQQGLFQGVDQQIKDEKDRRQTIEAKMTFVKNAKTYNDGWPQVYDLMRNITNSDILLKSMALDAATHSVINVEGFATSEETIARWWMDLAYRHKDVVTKAAFGLPPHPYPPNGQGSGVGGAPGMGAMGAMGAFSGGGMGAGSAGGMGGGRPMISAPGGPGSGGGMGRGGGGGNNQDKVGPAVIEDRVGINFTAAITLKTPLAGGIPAPAWPAGGGTTGGGGGGAPGGFSMPGSGGPGGSFGGAGSGGPGGSSGGPSGKGAGS